MRRASQCGLQPPQGTGTLARNPPCTLLSASRRDGLGLVADRGNCIGCAPRAARHGASSRAAHAPPPRTTQEGTESKATENENRSLPHPQRRTPVRRAGTRRQQV